MNTIEDMDALQEWAFEDDLPTSEEAITHKFARELVWMAEAARRWTLAQQVREERQMSTPEQQQGESKSSVTLARNAKGDRQQTVKVYEGTTDEEMARIMDLALSTYNDLEGGADS